MGVRTYDTLSRDHDTCLRKDRMLHAGLALLKIPGQSLLFGILADRFRVLRRLDVLIRREMIRHEHHLVLVKHMVRHLFDDRQCHRSGDVICHDHVKLCLDELTCLNRIQSRVSSQYLLCHCHSHWNQPPSYFLVIYPFAVSASAHSTAPPAAPLTVLWDKPMNL